MGLYRNTSQICVKNPSCSVVLRARILAMSPRSPSHSHCIQIQLYTHIASSHRSHWGHKYLRRMNGCFLACLLLDRPHYSPSLDPGGQESERYGEECPPARLSQSLHQLPRHFRRINGTEEEEEEEVIPFQQVQLHGCMSFLYPFPSFHPPQCFLFFLKALLNYATKPYKSCTVTVNYDHSLYIK